MTPNAAQQVMQIVTGYVASSALHIAATLNVADHVAAGAETSADLARVTGANEDALYRILRLLASPGVFEQIGSRRFALTPAAELLRKDVRGVLSDLGHVIEGAKSRIEEEGLSGRCEAVACDFYEAVRK